MRFLMPLFGAAILAQAPITVPQNSSLDTIVELAAQVLPSPRQLAWQRTQCNAFVHFGINTFTDREWGDGTESPATFAPTAFDATQWVATFRSAGMSGLVLTCKHHDGFCLWPTTTTTHSVASSPFRSGHGDVVGEVAAACKQGGMKFGVYLSPWDRHQPTFGTVAYQAVFLQQLRELCTNYGPLFEVWFDGAHCPADDPQQFDWQAVFRLVRELQPDAAIAITGPDVRWVGNEAGQTRDQEWSVLPLTMPAPGTFAADRDSWRALWSVREKNQQGDLGSREQLANAQALCWWPAETDVSIRPGWFHHAREDSLVKQLPTLLDYWFSAVGGNAVLLLNVPADRRGLIGDADARSLRALGDHLQATFGTNLAAAAAGATQKTYPKVGEVYFPQPTTVDVFDLGEDVAATGQRVEQFRIEVLQNGGWRECARGTTIGMRRLLRTEPITGDGFRYWIERARGKVQIAHFDLFRQPRLLAPPTIGRSIDGTVTIRGGGDVHFTIDGEGVSRSSPRYEAAFVLPDGGTVRAATFGPEADSSEATKTFGLCQRDWRIVECSSEQGGSEAAAKMIDGDPDTHWHSRWSPDSPPPPHHVTIDLGHEVMARGFTYQPRSQGNNGTVADYEFDGSNDGTTWRRLAEGTFANIADNPVPQVVSLGEPTRLRYVRFVALRECQGRAWASCAELGVLVPTDAEADAIHARVLTIDTHKDIDPKLAPDSLPDDPKTREQFRRRFDPTVRGSAQVDFPKMREGGYDCAFFIVYVGQGPLTDAGYHRALGEANAKFDAIHRMVQKHGDVIGLATTPDDVERLHREGKLIACIGIENGYPMGTDLAPIAEFHARGARYMGITHNGHNQLGDSHTPAEPMHGGLSDLGRQAIAEMNRVGIMVDISHTGRATMLQAVAASKAPVIASHSGARAVNDHGRNLDDEQLRAMAANGGVVQCVALAEYVKSSDVRSAAVDAWMDECGVGTKHRGDDASDAEREQRWQRYRDGIPAIDAKYPRANVQDFVDHIDHVVAIAGIDHVGIGSDFDGGGGIDGWNDASETKNVTRELVRRGYTEAEVAKIWGGNLLRVWREVEKVAASLQK